MSKLFFITTKRVFSFYPIVVAALAVLVASCSGGGSDPAFVRNAPGTLEVSHASGLRIERLSDGYLVEVRNPQDTAVLMGTYRFSRNSLNTTHSYTAIQIPVQRAALNSTTFVPFFAHMDAHEAIVGVSYANRVTDERVKAQWDAGTTLEIAGGDGLDMERVLMCNPDVVMAYIFGNANYTKVIEAGLPLVLNMEYKESTPLGRAEWIKLIGIMLDRYEEAEAIFKGIEKRYKEVQEQAASAPHKPTVFSGSKYERTWFTPGNASFVAQFIRDAGAVYAFEHIEGQGNTELDFESVLSTLNTADYWGLIVSSREEFTLSQLLSIAPEYATINAFKQGQVFVCNTYQSDYFGAAVMEPEVILADLVSIIHPGLMPEHEYTYFRPVVVDVKS